MTMDPHIGTCLLRARDAFERRPSTAVHEDSPATAVWVGGLATRLEHAALPLLRTDMPTALGGEGVAPSPGWYFRAGVASCLATSIAMQAAMCGIALTHVAVQARSKSDARGMLGSAPGVPPGPLRFSLTVTLQADGTSPEALHALVAAAQALAPMSGALRRPLDAEVEVEVQPATAAA